MIPEPWNCFLKHSYIEFSMIACRKYFSHLSFGVEWYQVWLVVIFPQESAVISSRLYSGSCSFMKLSWRDIDIHQIRRKDLRRINMLPYIHPISSGTH
jgi:hypothetical protein